MSALGYARATAMHPPSTSDGFEAATQALQRMRDALEAMRARKAQLTRAMAEQRTTGDLDPQSSSPAVAILSRRPSTT